MIKEIMAKSTELGMQTFDQALFDLAESGRITQEDALRNADSINELRLRFKLKSKNQEKSGLVDQLSLHEEPKEEDESEETQNIPLAANTANSKPAQAAVSV
jgi:twitching motility protein PilU